VSQLDREKKGHYPVESEPMAFFFLKDGTTEKDGKEKGLRGGLTPAGGRGGGKEGLSAKRKQQQRSIIKKRKKGRRSRRKKAWETTGVYKGKRGEKELFV